MDTPQDNQGSAGSRLAAIPVKSIIALAIGLAMLIATVAVAVMWTRESDYRVLFANLGDRDSGAVIAALNQINVPYRFSEGGGAILVPAASVHDARIKLASQGLPRGGTVGFELMESQKFGATQFQERLNFQRGLEGELTRSIQSLGAVQSARVHLALPSQNGFLREQQKPSASVLLMIHPGRSIDRSQVAGIVHLVASSIPDMNPKSVSVVDQNGVLLSNSDGNASAGLDASQLAYRKTVEASHAQRIMDILEPILGRSNIRAQVSADIDFTQTESTAEEYRPNQGKDLPATVRSQQVSESGTKDGAGANAQGVPGALSNQPPAPASAPINGAAQPVQAAGATGQASGALGNSRRDAVTNYEVDKTIKVTRNPTGVVKRLNAAIVINHRKVVEKGKTNLVPLTEKELENINALVREAIGFSKERGDSVNVVNAPFTEEEQAKAQEVPLWKQPFVIETGKDIAKQAGLVLLGLIILFGVIRPALKTMQSVVAPQAAAPSRVVRTVQNDVSLPPPIPPPPPPPPVPPKPPLVSDDVMKMAKDDPATVANVVKTWMNKDESSGS